MCQSKLNSKPFSAPRGGGGDVDRIDEFEDEENAFARVYKSMHEREGFGKFNK